MNSLKRIAGERGLTYTQLSNLTGIPMSTIGNAAAGINKLSPERVKLVAEALAVDMGELADVTGSGSPWHGKGSAIATKQTPEALAIGEKKEDPEIEKLWLYLHQLERRVRDLEAER